MSGGVDSAVAAARAVDAGHDVVGVHLALSRQRATLRTGSRGCCTVEDALDARRAANLLGIPFYVWDFSERFALDVVDNFVALLHCLEVPRAFVDEPMASFWMAASAFGLFSTSPLSSNLVTMASICPSSSS